MTPAKGIKDELIKPTIDVKMHHPLPPGGGPGKKRVLLKKQATDAFSESGIPAATGRVALMSQQLSPLHTRGLDALASKALLFDRSYLEPPKPQLTTQTYQEVAEGDK